MPINSIRDTTTGFAPKRSAAMPAGTENTPKDMKKANASRPPAKRLRWYWLITMGITTPTTLRMHPNAKYDAHKIQSNLSGL
jgi:hypothetical protein